MGRLHADDCRERAGAAWSFSLEISAPLAADHTATFSNFNFALDGSQLDNPATFVEFFTAASSGLFDVALANNDLLALFGDQVFNARGSLIPGVYAADIDAIAPSPLALASGSGQVTIALASDSSAVPEPSSFAAFAIGLMAVTCAAHWRARMSRPV